jgi:prophage antirepressor-like protein
VLFRGSRFHLRRATTFTFPVANANVCTLLDEKGEPWFVAKDVCVALGYHVKTNGDVNTTHAFRILNDDEVITHLMSDKGRPSLLISESGLFKLVMRSDKPIAKRFQDWVTRDVLPAIRKDGAYIMGEEKVVTGEMSDLEFLAKAELVGQTFVRAIELAGKHFGFVCPTTGEFKIGPSWAETH